MKYKEWTGELEGMLPDVGRVAKGRVLLIDTDGKTEALKGHEKSFSSLSLEEGEARWQKQLKADAKEAAPVEPESTPEAKPESAHAPETQTDAPTTDAPAETDAGKSASPKGGKK